MIESKPKTNTRPAALRKTGAAAYFEYLVMGVLALIYYWAFSHENIVRVFRGFEWTGNDLFSGHAAMYAAVLFASLYLFTMPRFGLISLPRWFNPTCKYLSVFCIERLCCRRKGTYCDEQHRSSSEELRR